MTKQFTFYSAKTYSEHCQTSNNVNNFQFLTSFAKSSILDVWQESEYAPTQ